MIPSADATCRSHVTIETLSALRDALLAPTEEQRLRAHIATCQACEARLAGFDRVAKALKRHRDLEPDQRIWQRIAPRLAQRRRRALITMQRSAIGGITAAAIVIALVVLFVGVFNNHQGGPRPVTTLTVTSAATSVATATVTATIAATATAASTPITIANLPTPAQVWGAQGGATTLELGNFQMGGMTPDGKRLLGYRPAADGVDFEVGWLDVATRVFTRIDLSPVNGLNKINTPPTCCLTDGRYYVGSNGVTEGASVTAPWYYDAQTGQLHNINSKSLFSEYVHAGLLYYQGGPNALSALDLSTDAAVSLPGTAALANRVAISWPYAVFTTPGGATSGWQVYNFQTGASVILAQLRDIFDTQLSSGALDGDAFFYGLSVGNSGNAGYNQFALEELDHSTSAASRPVQLGALITGNVNVTVENANTRLITVGNTDFSCHSSANGPISCNYSLAWDRALNKLILLSPSEDAQSFLAGQYLAVLDKVNNQVTIYNTALLPTK